MTIPANSNDPVSISTNQGNSSLVRSVSIFASAILTGIIIGWLNAHGFATTDIVFLGEKISPSLLIGGGVFTTVFAIATAVWGWLSGLSVGKLITDTKIAGVMSGIKLVTSGQALNVEGDTIQVKTIAPPLPVTEKSANEIVAKFGPTTDELNAASLKAAKEIK